MASFESQIRRIGGALAIAAIAVCPNSSRADNGGVGFWLPGSMGSLAAVPGQPGWSITTVYLHLNALAGGGLPLQNNSNIVLGLHAQADAIAWLPTYTFATPILGGQLTVGAAGVPGNVGVGINATLTGPRGNQISGSAFDNRATWAVGSSRVDLQACKLEYSIVSPK